MRVLRLAYVPRSLCAEGQPIVENIFIYYVIYDRIICTISRYSIRIKWLLNGRRAASEKKAGKESNYKTKYTDLQNCYRNGQFVSR